MEPENNQFYSMKNFHQASFYFILFYKDTNFYFVWVWGRGGGVVLIKN